jgi:hypothetical protein
MISFFKAPAMEVRGWLVSNLLGGGGCLFMQATGGVRRPC